MGKAHITPTANALYFVINLLEMQNGSVIRCVKINQPECSTTVSLLLWLKRQALTRQHLLNALAELLPFFHIAQSVVYERLHVTHFLTAVVTFTCH